MIMLEEVMSVGAWVWLPERPFDSGWIVNAFLKNDKLL